MAKKDKYSKEDEVTLKEYLAAQQELEELQKANGLEKEEKGLSRLLSKFFDSTDSRKKHRVKKKTYIILALLLGWCGGHRFYEQRWILALIYFALAVIMFPQLVGFPLAMTVIDLCIAIPIPKDEEGYMEI